MMLARVRPVADKPQQERYYFECPNCGNDLVQIVTSEAPQDADSRPVMLGEDESFAIGALAKSSGASVETIRYYERIGLLKSPPRSAGGRRVYSRADFRALIFIRRARDLGFSLDEIGTLLGLDAAKKVTCGEVRQMAVRHLEGIRAKLRDLQKLESILATTVSRCSGDAAPECPVLDILDINHCDPPFPVVDAGVTQRAE
jgi:MerR family mercuric resistance operon transcriptional regulator